MHECTEKLRLARIDEVVNKIHDKLFVSNGERAMVDVVRENTEFRERTQKSMRQAVVWMVGLVAGGHGLDKLIEFLMGK